MHYLVYILASVLVLQSACGRNAETSPSVPQVGPISKPQLIDQTPAPTPRSAPPERPLYRKEGWTIPGEDIMKIVEPRSRANIGTLSAYRTGYELTQDFVITATRRTTEESGLASDRGESWRIWSVTKFESQNKPFCFFLKGTKVKLNPDGTVKNAIASATGLVISDMDGDGVFETLEFAAVDAVAPKVPEGLER